jgi:hypothetical protein
MLQSIFPILPEKAMPATRVLAQGARTSRKVEEKDPYFPLTEAMIRKKNPENVLPVTLTPTKWPSGP